MRTICTFAKKIRSYLTQNGLAHITTTTTKHWSFNMRTELNRVEQRNCKQYLRSIDVAPLGQFIWIFIRLFRYLFILWDCHQHRLQRFEANKSKHYLLLINFLEVNEPTANPAPLLEGEKDGVWKYRPLRVCHTKRYALLLFGYICVCVSVVELLVLFINNVFCYKLLWQSKKGEELRAQFWQLKMKVFTRICKLKRIAILIVRTAMK